MNRAVLAFAAVLSLATSVAAQSPKASASPKSDQPTSAVEAKVRHGWQNFKDGKNDAYAADLAENSAQVWADNQPPRDKTTAIKDMASIKVNSYSLSKMVVSMLGPNAALATYEAKVNLTASGQKMAGNLAVTEVWVKQHGEWKELRYHESEIK